ncbi:MAG: ATP-binding cassette domain-containing protein [Candidatus Lambdaproteobacteria bacterium]|nr:ATP-binding cassette domain-containing protein [Candidatus Lambdaproteobacteria bacterium]
MAPVLSDVSLRIEPGSFVYLTGVSGAGKTTVFRLLTLQERPDRGEVLFGGVNVARFNADQRAHHRRAIGMVFQDYRLLLNESVEDNVALPQRVAGVTGAELRRATRARLEEVGLAERAREPVLGLSGGEKQLVAIARALAFRPPVFFADEPTGNLDQTVAFKVMDLLKRIHERGSTVIVATHDLNLIRSYRARTLLIKERKVHEVRLVEPGAAGRGEPPPAPPAEIAAAEHP